jgi:putative Ca2+/H+ antiporter (TMEM165/GDT1 family)
MLFITICAILILIGIAMSGNMPNAFILVCVTLVFLLFGILFLFKCLNANLINFLTQIY